LDATLVIGNKNYSSWSLRSWLILKKLDYDFEEIVVPLYQDDYHEQLKRYSERAQVPVYIEDKVTIWDSLAIAEYLAESHREPEKSSVLIRSGLNAVPATTMIRLTDSGYLESSALLMRCSHQLSLGFVLTR